MDLFSSGDFSVLLLCGSDGRRRPGSQKSDPCRGMFGDSGKLAGIQQKLEGRISLLG